MMNKMIVNKVKSKVSTMLQFVGDMQVHNLMS